MLRKSLEKLSPASPYPLFKQWLTEAPSFTAFNPATMSMSTVNAHGQPSSRMVSLTSHSEEELVFYAKYTSRKGIELASNPHAALLFFYGTRQIRTNRRTIRR
jgi:pyridoxamine 5'-phosphate oxidase